MTPPPQPRNPARFAAALRRELSERNRAWCQAGSVGHQLSYGEMPVVVYSPDQAGLHGNFLPESYRAILANPAWRRRLDKVHTSARSALPAAERRWRELDSANSSDALLMNVFCHPAAFANGRVSSLLGIEAAAENGAENGAAPIFGHRARVPLRNGRSDRTEVDMLLGHLLVEAKITEAGFQSTRAAALDAYRDFQAVFDLDRLPAHQGHIGGYQLIRNVLAAFSSGQSFCVLCDARRPDLIEQWFTILQAVRLWELKTRLKLLTWQELAEALPGDLCAFLAAKYGILPGGRALAQQTG